MEILMVTAFVSLVLVVAGIVLFVSRTRAGDFEHGDRLSLLPLADDDGTGSARNGVHKVDDDVDPTRGGSA